MPTLISTLDIAKMFGTFSIISKINIVKCIWVVFWIICSFFTYRIVKFFSIDIRRKSPEFTKGKKITLYVLIKLLCVYIMFFSTWFGICNLNDALFIGLFTDVNLFIFIVLKRTIIDKRNMILENFLIVLRVILFYWAFSITTPHLFSPVDVLSFNIWVQNKYFLLPPLRFYSIEEEVEKYKYDSAQALEDHKMLKDFKIAITKRLKEPSREPLPPMDIDKIIKDVLSNGEDGIKSLEQNYPKKTINILKPALISFQARQYHYGKYKKCQDKEGKLYFTSAFPKDTKRFYLDEMLKYGRVLSPILVYDPVYPEYDRYFVPLAFKDSVVAIANFNADTIKCSGVSWFAEIISHFSQYDSVKADSIIRISLSPGEKIISKKFFKKQCPIWGFLIEKTDGENVDTTIYLEFPEINKVRNINTIKTFSFFKNYVDRVTHP
jgi:hypothetical protein